MTYEDKEKSAVNNALHYHHLVEHARNQESLSERAYHHKYLNNLTTVNKHLDLLKEV